MYVVTLAIMPLLRPDLDILRAHPEDYAAGPFGLLVNIGYVALAVAAGSFAYAGARAGAWGARLAALAFAVGAAVCVANAIDPTLGSRRHPIEVGVIGLVIGPVVWSLRTRARAGGAIAGLTLAGFVALLAAPEAVGGAVNRLFDGLIALWCIVAGIGSGRRTG